MAYGAWAFNGDLSMYANVTAALHGYVGPCGTEPGSAHEDQVPIDQSPPHVAHNSGGLTLAASMA